MNPQRTTRVLIIEDSQIVQAVLARNLSAIPSVEVAGVACTGRSGINAIRELRPDVVLLDLTMPDGTGLGVLTAIREDEHRPLLIVRARVRSAQRKVAQLLRTDGSCTRRRGDGRHGVGILRHRRRGSGNQERQHPPRGKARNQRRSPVG